MVLKEKWNQYLSLRISDLQKSQIYKIPTLISIVAVLISISFGIANMIQNNVANARSDLQEARYELQKLQIQLSKRKDDLESAEKDLDDARYETAYAEEKRDELQRNLDLTKKNMTDAEKELFEKQKLSANIENELAIKRKKISLINDELNKAKEEIKSLENWFTVKAPKAKTSDVDVYNLSASDEIADRVKGLLLYKGFNPNMKFWNPRKEKQAKTTSILYYGTNYKEVAESLKKGMDVLFKNKVDVAPGSSNFAENKIIIHLVGK